MLCLNLVSVQLPQKEVLYAGTWTKKMMTTSELRKRKPLNDGGLPDGVVPPQIDDGSRERNHDVDHVLLFES